MNTFLQYTLAIVVLIYTFLHTAMTLPSLIDMWQKWIDDRHKRRDNKE